MNQKTRILLADDHALVRVTLKNQLNQESDLTVVSDVETTDEALTETLRLQPDLILLDIDLPGQHCFEVARTIKTQLPNTRIVFLSAFHHDHYIEQAIAAEASGYITKSEPPEKLIEAIRAVISGEIYYSPEVQMRIVIDNNKARLNTSNRTLVSELSRREIEVLRYIGLGFSQKQIAATMHISVRTAAAHTQRVMDKLDIHDRVNLAKYAIREGIAEA